MFAPTYTILIFGRASLNPMASTPPTLNHSQLLRELPHDWTLGYRHIFDLRDRFPLDIPPPPSPSSVKRPQEVCLQSETRLIGALKQEGAVDVWSALQQLGTIEELEIFDSNGYSSDILAPFIITCDTVLVLEMDLGDEQPEGPARLDDLFRDVTWPSLRVLRLPGLKCTVAPLTRFLIAHPELEELALAQSMTGPTWSQLDLPSDALCNLRTLHCRTNSCPTETLRIVPSSS
ncbi:hypothetical protein H0H92_015984 [Tricholoma furcatifolium]|nr:hypothetical protein H0H92_015984 [Tricholoma furcatifolium]